jgi:hypothetical protein
MELVLNFAWVMLAALMFCMWLHFGQRTGVSGRMQLTALAVLILILLPVISVTDDLQAALNPAETDCCLRRDHACSTPHAISAAFAALPQRAFPELSFGILRIAAQAVVPDPVVEHPALTPIQNRPPPAA